MSAASSEDLADGHDSSGDVAALMPMVRRIVLSRVGAHPAADDLIQETLVRVLAAQARIEPGMLEPYAIVTARNVIATMWRDADRVKRNLHKVVDLRAPGGAGGVAVGRGGAGRDRPGAWTGWGSGSGRRCWRTRWRGRTPASLAARTGSTSGAVAAQLNRTRARMRVEYLLALEQTEPPTDRCRPVLLALSSGDRRRQREVDAAGHVLTCDLCARLSEPLTARGQTRDDIVRIPINRDADIVSARQAARELAGKAGLAGTDLTLLATAVSEVVRNIVRFTQGGEIVVEVVERDGRRGVHVVARDTGPGIADIEQAMTDGYSTYAGLGLGLPGARRLMDEFAVVSEADRGTTVTMTMWSKKGRG